MPLQSPSLPKLRLLKKGLKARVETSFLLLVKMVVETPTKPRRPKIRQWGPLLARLLARCEGRGCVIVVKYFVVINTF